MANQSIPSYLRNTIRQSGIVGQLIAVNVVVFILVTLIGIIGKLTLNDGILNEIYYQLAAPGDIKLLLYKPWSLITQLFMHGSFMHLFFNMFGLYFVGKLFVQFLGEKRLITTYFLGGIFGYLIHILGSNFIPYFAQSAPADVIGASGSVFAIFAAAAFHKPDLKVRLFGAFTVTLIFVALAYILMDVVLLAQDDKVARLAHLGGAIFGGISIINVYSPKQFMNRFDKLFNFKLKNIFKRKPKFKVYEGDVRNMTDDEYNANKKAKEDRTNAILDKIAKKGYEGLTKEEKAFLFKESKKNNS